MPTCHSLNLRSYGRNIRNNVRPSPNIWKRLPKKAFWPLMYDEAWPFVGNRENRQWIRLALDANPQKFLRRRLL
jgi:hypothetical protein